MRVTERIDAKWISQIDGKPTFRGVIDDYLDEGKLHWRLELTIEDYAADFNNKIIPKIVDHNKKTIDQYTMEDFDYVIQLIREEGKGSSEKVYLPYADSTIQHFRRIIRAVVSAAVEANLCDDILWGTEYTLSEEEAGDYSQAIDELVRLKKSFTPEEERKIAEEIFINPKQRGQEMGLLLMDVFGLRNNEACGVDFGCIKPMDGHPGYYELWVYKSTKRGTNVVGSSGKTKNADRIIPIPGLVYVFLMKRKEFVESELHRIVHEKGINPEDIPSVDELPIVCYGMNYLERCASRHLTAASKELFKNLVSTPHSDVKQRIKNTKKEHLFGPLESSFDILSPQEPAPHPQVPPIDPVDPPESFNQENMPTALITIKQLEAIVDVVPALAEHIQTMRLNNIDSVSLFIDDIEELDLAIDDVTHLFDFLNAQEPTLTNQDVQILDFILKDKIQRTSISPVERPIGTLRQFYNSGLIFLPPRTKLQDCQLKDLFLSYYYDEYKHYFDRNYKKLGQRILYCEFTPIRMLDETPYPSLRFNMYWGKPRTKITLYINFEDNAPYSAKEFYENFIQNKLELRMNSEGISEWIPKNASRIVNTPSAVEHPDRTRCARKPAKLCTVAAAVVH